MIMMMMMLMMTTTMTTTMLIKYTKYLRRRGHNKPKAAKVVADELLDEELDEVAAARQSANQLSPNTVITIITVPIKIPFLKLIRR